MTTKTAVKNDGDKVRLELLPFAALTEVGKAFGHGAKKYADHNYRNGMRWGRIHGAALRHLFAWGDGESVDPEWGLSHLAHAGACVLMLADCELKGHGMDDRWKAPGPCEDLHAMGYVCTSPRQHVGRHEAHDGDGNVLLAWAT